MHNLSAYTWIVLAGYVIGSGMYRVLEGEFPWETTRGDGFLGAVLHVGLMFVGLLMLLVLMMPVLVYCSGHPC